MKKEKSNTSIIIIFGVIVVLVLLFPKLYNYLENKNLPKVEDINNETNKEEKIIDDELLDSLHYPLMRTSINDPNTYYKLDKFTVNDMSNQDILYNAFLDMYEGNIVNNEFNAEYIELRIKNILGKNINYTLESFTVPDDSSSKYIGTWNYDINNSKFIFSPNKSIIEYVAGYYTLEEFIKAEFDNNDVIVYKYVGFAKVDSSGYTIYKDASMTDELQKGTFTSIEDLNNIFKSLNDKRIYKYTFKNTLCTYEEYCLYEGKWVNEIK